MSPKSKKIDKRLHFVSCEFVEGLDLDFCVAKTKFDSNGTIILFGSLICIRYFYFDALSEFSNTYVCDVLRICWKRGQGVHSDSQKL